MKLDVDVLALVVEDMVLGEGDGGLIVHHSELADELPHRSVRTAADIARPLGTPLWPPRHTPLHT